MSGWGGRSTVKRTEAPPTCHSPWLPVGLLRQRAAIFSASCISIQTECYGWAAGGQTAPLSGTWPSQKLLLFSYPLRLVTSPTTLWIQSGCWCCCFYWPLSSSYIVGTMMEGAEEQEDTNGSAWCEDLSVVLMQQLAMVVVFFFFLSNIQKFPILKQQTLYLVDERKQLLRKVGEIGKHLCFWKLRVVLMLVCQYLSGISGRCECWGRKSDMLDFVNFPPAALKPRQDTSCIL